MRAAHEEGVHRPRCASALGDAPDYEGLASAAVAGCEDPFGASGVLAVLGLEVAARVPFEAELLGQCIFGTEEAHGQEDEVGFEDLFGARHFAHLPLAFGVFRPLDAHRLDAG